MGDKLSQIEGLRKKNLERTKTKIKASVSKDQMIINAINNIEELEKSINVVAGRLREWFSLENPELEREVTDNERFIEIVLQNDALPSAMGSEFDPEDEQAMKALAAGAAALVQTKTFLLLYLEKSMQKLCPNVLRLAGVTIGAKLLREARSLKRLASLQSSTVQLLGAEKALFRHIKTGARPPKYGYIINHPLIINSKQSDRGKASRALADKLSIAARLDYFKGEFQADSLLKDLEKKFKK